MTWRVRTGIIYIDEIDKISRNLRIRPLTRDVSGEGSAGVAETRGGTSCNVPPRRPEASRAGLYPVDTTNILFIAGGAFVGLDQLIAQRTMPKRLGFGVDASSAKIHGHTGAAPCAGRGICWVRTHPRGLWEISCVDPLADLDVPALIRILTEPRNALVRQYQALFEIEALIYVHRLGSQGDQRAGRR